jgi:hypothetical protein
MHHYRIFAVAILVQGLCLSGLIADAASGADGANVASGKRRAVLIGIDDDNVEGHLNFRVKDQSALKDRLQRGGFDPRHVRLLSDKAEDSALSATKSNIESAIESTCQEAAKGDLVLISFSGHGRQIANKCYLCPREGTLKNPQTMIAANWIFEKLAASQADVRIVLLDTCRDADGPGQRGGGRSMTSGLPEGVILLYSSSKGAVSIEDKKLDQGAYSCFLLDGLRGFADEDQNGKITLRELIGFAERKRQTRVEREFVKQQNPDVFLPANEAISKFVVSESGINRLDSFRGDFADSLEPLIAFIRVHSGGPVAIEIGRIKAPSDEFNFSGAIAGTLEETLRAAFHKVGFTGVQDGKGDLDWLIDGSYTKPSRAEPNVHLTLNVRHRKDNWVRDFNYVIHSTADICRIMGDTLTLPPDKDGNSMPRQAASQAAQENPNVTIKGNRVCASEKCEYSMEVLARSHGEKRFKPVVPRKIGGRAFIELKPGDEYELVLFNNSDHEVAANVTIDGLNVFHFSELRNKETRGPRYNNYIIAPEKERKEGTSKGEIIQGWHIRDTPPQKNYRLFQVKQYGELSGFQPKRENIGVITVSFANTELRHTLGEPNPGDLVTVPGDTTDVVTAPVERSVGLPHTFISLRYSR